MPTRTFCDLCDKRIPDDDPFYGISVSTNRRITTNSGWDGTRIKVGNQWIDADIQHVMLCGTCIVAILQKIAGLKENG